ncbi:transcriptional repressor NrdR [Candidatus Nomurabacteria bacterium]|nr:transcriptional repressor NrdR [Candidatus Saccharibacteria bacterium]MCA9312822.1 transcriptional repressor NrdR [Candidatus Saccharibacteria bacterium]MCB9822262.1 transcriptional repressor NrdR [Candidatus Nomurabacteria bacterium]
MKCPNCQIDDSKVIESRDVASGDSIRRRRECETCGHRFTTYERVERPNLVVVKKDGVRVIFDRQKVLAGIERASEKTSITGPQREEIVARIERALYDLGKPEVRAEQIGELVMDELAKADEVAYVRFASVYRHFTSIKSFEEGLSVLKARKSK